MERKQKLKGEKPVNSFYLDLSGTQPFSWILWVLPWRLFRKGSAPDEENQLTISFFLECWGWIWSCEMTTGTSWTQMKPAPSPSSRPMKWPRRGLRKRSKKRRWASSNVQTLATEVPFLLLFLMKERELRQQRWKCCLENHSFPHFRSKILQKEQGSFVYSDLGRLQR